LEETHKDHGVQLPARLGTTWS